MIEVNTIKPFLKMSVYSLMLLCIMQVNATELPKTITIASDQWCPYICDLETDKPGYLVEVSNAVFAKLGIQPIYHALGWQKSIDLVENSLVNAIFAAGESNHGKTLLSRELLGVDRTVLITRKNRLLESKDLYQTIDSMIMGVIVDYTYDSNGPLDNYIAQRKSNNDRIVILNHNASVQALFVMLNRSSIDIFPENVFVANYMAKSMGVISKLSLFDINRHDHMFMGFSPDSIGENLRDAFDQEVRLLKDSGKLGLIMHKYGIADEVSNHQHPPALKSQLEK